jgi:hypothetical protein
MLFWLVAIEVKLTLYGFLLLRLRSTKNHIFFGIGIILNLIFNKQCVGVRPAANSFRIAYSLPVGIFEGSDETSRYLKKWQFIY